MAQTQKIGKVHTNVFTDTDGTVNVVYHNTAVVKWNSKRNTVELNSGGWRTATTKSRMNQAATQFGLKFRVYQEKRTWFVRVGGFGADGKTVNFKDGMKFKVK